MLQGRELIRLNGVRLGRLWGEAAALEVKRAPLNIHSETYRTPVKRGEGGHHLAFLEDPCLAARRVLAVPISFMTEG